MNEALATQQIQAIENQEKEDEEDDEGFILMDFLFQSSLSRQAHVVDLTANYFITQVFHNQGTMQIQYIIKT